MEELLQMGREAGLKKLAEHDRNGTLKEYIERISPEHIQDGEVVKFKLLEDLNWW